MIEKKFLIKHIILYVILTIVTMGFGLCFLLGWDLRAYSINRHNRIHSKIIPAETDSEKENTGIVEI